jgi:NAD(P)H-dependent flavin oxidoreductase YrpB (nitropropane dioxygenase family)
MGTAVVVPQVVRAVPHVPVLGAGGISDGRGLAAMLALGADGVLLGTRFLATAEAPVHQKVKQAIVASDGTDTIVTDVGDILMGSDWPGAYARVARNRLIERWLGRPSEVRRNRDKLIAGMVAARKSGDVDEALLYWGQGAGLIDEIVPAAKVVTDIVGEAEEILTERLPALVARKAPTR